MADQSTGTRSWSAPKHEPGGPIVQVVELKDLVVAYAKQETVDPLRTLWHYLGLGIAGAVLIGTGIAFGLLALLRGLQQLTVFNDPGELDGGRWSWAPYLIAMFVGLVIAGLFVRSLYKFTQTQGSPRSPPPPTRPPSPGTTSSPSSVTSRARRRSRSRA